MSNTKEIMVFTASGNTYIGSGMIVGGWHPTPRGWDSVSRIVDDAGWLGIGVDVEVRDEGRVIGRGRTIALDGGGRGVMEPIPGGDAWVSAQRASGWRDYGRAVYAMARLGAPWERDDAPPENPEEYMRSWWEASRWYGLAPEDVRDEIRKADG